VGVSILLIFATLISTEYVYVAELVQLPVLTAHYKESLYKTCLYGDSLNLYGGGQANSILTHNFIKILVLTLIFSADCS
jgi:hypothetical protein